MTRQVAEEFYRQSFSVNIESMTILIHGHDVSYCKTLISCYNHSKYWVNSSDHQQLLHEPAISKAMEATSHTTNSTIQSNPKFTTHFIQEMPDVPAEISISLFLKLSYRISQHICLGTPQIPAIFTARVTHHVRNACANY